MEHGVTDAATARMRVIQVHARFGPISLKPPLHGPASGDRKLSRYLHSATTCFGSTDGSSSSPSSVLPDHRSAGRRVVDGPFRLWRQFLERQRGAFLDRQMRGVAERRRRADSRRRRERDGDRQRRARMRLVRPLGIVLDRAGRWTGTGARPGHHHLLGPAQSKRLEPPGKRGGRAAEGRDRSRGRAMPLRGLPTIG